MKALADEHERTMAFAEIAFGQIKALRQPASPRYFEVWYNYATGYNPSLNQTINEMLSRTRTLSEAQIEEIYDTYISPQRVADRIDHVGLQVQGQIEQIMATIHAAAGNASTYSENLANVTQKLGGAGDAPAMHALVESLVHATKEMEKNNQALEQRLSASKQEIDELQENLQTVRIESLTDPLTSLANRKFFDEALAKAVGHAKSSGEPLALLMADVDHFKRFNDTFGHPTGDQVLRLVAISMRQNIKSEDVAARYGGEEFVVVLAGTPLSNAVMVADHIRGAVMAKDLMKRSTGEHLGKVTISLGVAALGAVDTPQTLLERADVCLYAAKRNGRNRVVSEVDPELTVAAAKVA